MIPKKQEYLISTVLQKQKNRYYIHELSGLKVILKEIKLLFDLQVIDYKISYFKNYDIQVCGVSSIDLLLILVGFVLLGFGGKVDFKFSG
jgi:hypothetical protein